MSQSEFAIIGGGLSGLALADRLHRAGRDVHLFEARDRLGGRILTQVADGSGYDMGPSWFWPGQPRMAGLVQALGLEVFEQHATGALSYETETGEVLRDQGMSSMRGSWRLKGGMAGLTSGLAARLPRERVHLARSLVALAPGQVTFHDGTHWQAKTIILALPPRLAARLSYGPDLAPQVRAAMETIPTWMGGHAKFMAIYPRPFWRAAGLSGDAMSRRGPLVEIHDASPQGGPGGDDGPGALFGFLGLLAASRAGQDHAIVEACVAQLARIFDAGLTDPADATPRHTIYQDWAQEPFSASPQDHVPPLHHPAYGRPKALEPLWDGQLHLCATELAPEMGGFLEGALAAAAQTAAELLDRVP